MMALGLVETLGLVPALEAADAMLKAADVRLLEKSYADAGLVTITVAGSVSAVQASVEAGKATVMRFPGDALVGAHVIPRPDAELALIINLDPDKGKKQEEKAAEEKLYGSEFDVQVTLDGKLIVNHDAKFQGFVIAETPLSDLKKIKLQEWQ